MSNYDHAIWYAKKLAKEYKSVDLKKAAEVLSNNDAIIGSIAYKLLNKEDFLHWLRTEIAKNIRARKEFNIQPYEPEPGLYNEALNDYENFGKRWNV